MYAIKVTPNYYGGTINAPQETLITYRDLSDDLQSPDYDVAEYDTEEEAQIIIDTKLDTDDTYYLSHGEAGRPSYEIVNLDNLDQDCQKASGIDFGGYDQFEEIDADDLPNGLQDELDGQNTEYTSSGDDCDVYIADVDHGDRTYRIAYCPTTVALQLNVDDLGGINWDHQAYYYRQKD